MRYRRFGGSVPRAGYCRKTIPRFRCCGGSMGRAVGVRVVVAQPLPALGPSFPLRTPGSRCRWRWHLRGRHRALPCGGRAGGTGSSWLIATWPVLPLAAVYGFGLIPFAGQAWMSSGLSVGPAAGACRRPNGWERARAADQCVRCLCPGDWHCVPVLCVLLRLQTWLGLIGTGYWSLCLVGMGLEGETALCQSSGSPTNGGYAADLGRD